MNTLELFVSRLSGRLEGKPTNPRELTLDKRYDYSHGRQITADLKWYRGLTPQAEDKTEFLKVVRSGDKLGPALLRFVAGIAGLDPEWTIKRSDSDVTSELLGTVTDETPEDKKPDPKDLAIAKELNELEDTLTVWDRAVGLHNKLKLLYHTALWAALGYPRLYIPDSLDDARIQARSFESVEAALKVIYLNIIDPRSCGAIEDEHGNVLGYYYRYPSEDDKDKRDYIELHTPEEIKLYRQEVDGTLKEALETEDPGAPRNPLYRENERPEFMISALEHPEGGALDESLIDEQDSLNESKIEMRRNGRLGGHRQYITINADNPKDETGQDTVYEFGPSIVANVTGFQYADQDGKVIGVTTPQVVVVEPVDPEKFITVIKHHTLEILARYDQSHFESAFLAISGESKRESREAWQSRLELESGPVGQAYATILRNALRVAYWLTGKDDNAFDVYEVVPSLNLNVSNSDMDTIMKASDLVTAGHMTLERFVEVSDLVPNKQAELAALKRQADDKQQSEADALAALANVPTPEVTAP